MEQAGTDPFGEIDTGGKGVSADFGGAFLEDEEHGAFAPSAGGIDEMTSDRRFAGTSDA
jgi:hypothetical protein